MKHFLYVEIKIKAIIRKFEFYVLRRLYFRENYIHVPLIITSLLKSNLYVDEFILKNLLIDFTLRPTFIKHPQPDRLICVRIEYRLEIDQ